MALDLSKIIKAAKNTDLIITPTLNDWLIQHGDDELPEKVGNKIHELLTTPPRVRSHSFSASSAGLCERRQVLKYLGMPEDSVTDPRLQNIFSDGKWRHLRWQAMLLMAGLLDEVEDPLFWNRMRARATPDGRGIVSDAHPKKSWRGKEFGFELKGVGSHIYPGLVKNGQIKEEHRRQVAFNCLLADYDLYVIIYENKGTNEWHEWVIEPDEQLINEQRIELERLNYAVDNKQLPKMLPQCAARMGPLYKSCPFGGAGGACVKSGTWPTIH